MKSTNFRYFSKNNYIDISLYNSLLEDIPLIEQASSSIINTDGTITYNLDTKGHIRNLCDNSDRPLDSILPTSVIEFKNLLKVTMLQEGMKNPVVRGVQGVSDPPSIKWHKDYVSPELQIEPSKRWITFFIICEDNTKNTLMVGPSGSSIELWNIGCKYELITNLLIGHNQYLGHEYIRLAPLQGHIFSILWYDLI